MIASMTGFGKGSKTEAGITAEAEIRSVNGRFLDIGLKIPRDFSDKEHLVRDLVKKKISRGKVSLLVTLKREGESAKYAQIDNEKLSAVSSFLKELKKKSHISGTIRMEHLLNFSQYFIGENGFTNGVDFELILGAVEEAVNSFNEMRRMEGRELSKDLSERCAKISDTVQMISELNKKSVEEYFERLKSRASEIMEDFASDEVRLTSELAFLTEKYDVTEECVRRQSHISLFEEAISNSEGAGRKLNFITQEMNTEANTINSKTISTEISHKGIFIKEELEKIREQIQNIE